MLQNLNKSRRKMGMKNGREISHTPTENQWFEVNPLAIEKKFFEEKKKDWRQESVRQLILMAFEELSNNTKYQRKFKTFMPKKTWVSKSVPELIQMSHELGDHNIDITEQAFEWAQRISNGETWESVCRCNNFISSYYRLVIFKDGSERLVGASHDCDTNFPKSDVDFSFPSEKNADEIIPLVVSYED